MRKKGKKKRGAKEIDGFIALSKEVGEYISKNSKIFIGGVSAFIILFLSISSLYLYLEKREEKAFSFFNDGVRLYEKKDYTSALEKFKVVVESFPRTDAYPLSLLYLGNCYYNLGRYDKAIKAYSRLYRKKGKMEGYFDFIITNSLGYCYEAKGDYRNALKYFSRLKGSLIDEFYYINVGRCYEELEEKDKARKIYKEFVSKYPNSRYKILIEAKLKDLS